MTSIADFVAEFAQNDNYNSWEHAKAQAWVDATRCGAYDVRLLSEAKDSLSRSELKVRESIKARTLEFIRLHFDDRPDVVRLIDNLLAELGVADDTARRDEFLPFEEIYSAEEIKVLLLKRLHRSQSDGGYTRGDIAEYFSTSTKTVDKYIHMMLPAANPGADARILGQAVQLDPSWGSNIPESTTHPLFLPLNMVELYTLVDMLVEHSQNDVEGRLALSILDRISVQTTDYAQERLARIEGFEEALHAAQAGEERGPDEAIMFHEKEGYRATVRYAKNGEEESHTGLISRSRKNKSMIILVEGDQVFHIPYRDIIELKSPAK